MKNPNKNKHLTAQQRDFILSGLEQNLTATAIGEDIGKERSTVSKEVKNHVTMVTAQRYKSGQYTMCALVKDCPDANTKKCRESCKLFQLRECKRHKNFPYVCNGCSKLKKGCPITTHKLYYIPSQAHFEYSLDLSESRKGLRISEGELDFINELLIDGTIKRKNSVYATIAPHIDEMPVQISTIYSYIEKGYLTAKPVHQPVMVKLKPRKPNPKVPTMPKEYSKGREYLDYKEKEAKLDDNAIVFEMDTVEGTKGESDCFLTIIEPNNSLLIIYKLESKRQVEVKKKLEYFLTMVHKYVKPSDIVVLTDRGSEFHKPLELETQSETGEKLCSIFYCDPQASSQKPRIENAHKLIRRIIPKGKSLKRYKQKDCNYIMSQINSYPRFKFNGSTPFEEFSSSYNATILYRLNIKKLPHTEVSLAKI